MIFVRGAVKAISKKSSRYTAGATGVAMRDAR